MDRSKIPGSYRRLAAWGQLFVLTLAVVWSSLAAAESPAPPPASSSSQPAAGIKASEAKQVTRFGVFMGRIIDIDRHTSSFVVRPSDKSLRNREFFVDQQTAILIDKKPGGFDDLYFGDKAAIKYFAEGEIAVAEKVFVVFGEFTPEDYDAKPKAKKTATKKASGGAKH